MTLETRRYIIEAHTEAPERRGNVLRHGTSRLDLRMRSYSSPPSFTFNDLTLRQAEEEIVGAAIEVEYALIALYGATRIRSFRSEQAYELNQIANVLFAWHDKGLYNPERNRDRLEKHFDPYYLDTLWSMGAWSPEYVDALCMALVKAETLEDEAVAARVRLLNEQPSRPAPPQPVRQRPKEPSAPQKKGGFVGGIPI